MGWREVFEEARRSNGVLHVTDGEPHGISRRTLERRARRDGWRTPHPGYGVVLAPGCVPDRLTLVTAAVKAVGEPVFAGRRTAAWLHAVMDRAAGPVELVVPNERRSPRLRGVRVWRSRTLRDHHLTSVGALPATTVPRTMFDLAAVLPEEMLRDVTIDALQRRRMSLEELHALSADLIRPPGVGKVRRILRGLAHERPESALDRRTRALLRPYGFGLHPRPFPFRCPDGVVIHLDIAIPWAWFAIECDGFAFHNNREAFRRDRVRWSQAQRGGWRITWVDRNRLKDDPGSIIEEVREVLAEADPDRPPPPELACTCHRCR